MIRFSSHLLCNSRTAVIGAGILFSVILKTDGATINAASASLNDVSAAVASAIDGDTVVIPPGTASWTSTLSFSRGIILQGAGNDQTVILDDVPLDNNGNAWVVKASLSSTQSFRMTGITVRNGSRTVTPASAAVGIGGTCFSLRIDHCHFDQLYETAINTGGWVYGVIDHCLFTGRAGLSEAAILVYQMNWGGGSNGFGDGSWADPPYFGSEKFLFIEDNTFNNLASNQTNAGIDCYAGGRYVCRYNTFNNCLPLNHGTESPGRLRGSRAMEIYNNNINFTFGATCGQNRGGAALYHDNTFTGAFNNSSINLNVYREFYPFRYFGGASGNDLWDTNDSHGMYASGKHTGATASQTLVVSNAGWKTNQWVGYSVTNTTQVLSTGQNYSSYITSNTSDTITYALDNSFGPYMTFNNGDSFVIYKVLIALDQPGRGQGDLLANVNNVPMNTAASYTVAWPHQALEPVYAWNNTVNGSAVTVTSNFPTLQENRDYYNNTPMPGYTPYTYPYPLVSGVPPAPQNLRVVP
jgi:hypothetical protein